MTMGYDETFICHDRRKAGITMKLKLKMHVKST